VNHIVVGDHCVFDKDAIPDVQNTRKDFYATPIKKVGVRNIEAPILVWQKDENRAIQVHATFSAYVELTEESKGINMSRCGRVIMAQARKHMDINVANMHSPTFNLMEAIVRDLQKQHGSKTAYVKCRFAYPSWTKVYASKLDTVEYVDVVWEAIADGTEVTELLTVENVGISLCPCSKEMSLLKNNLSSKEYSLLQGWMDNSSLPQSLIDKINRAGFGAHNQRSHVAITVQLIPGRQLWFEDLIAITDKSFSAPIRAILKREDEKVEGELAYLGGYYDDNGFTEVEGTGPKFVEDISRDAARQLDEMLDKQIKDYVVRVLNDESIHSRNLQAVAVLTAGRSLQ
jgi:GTP cyclohydrolase I